VSKDYYGVNLHGNEFPNDARKQLPYTFFDYEYDYGSYYYSFLISGGAPDKVFMIDIRQKNLIIEINSEGNTKKR